LKSIPAAYAVVDGHIVDNLFIKNISGARRRKMLQDRYKILSSLYEDLITPQISVYKTRWLGVIE
jgi:hypothetical protein